MNCRLRFQLSSGARQALLSERVDLLQLKEDQQELAEQEENYGDDENDERYFPFIPD